jgi:uncharacterized membrane protein
MQSSAAPRRTYASERLVAFSDAVMAVAITILVLDLKLPEGVSDADLGAVLRGSLHGAAVYALSFAVIGLFWAAHNDQFSYIRRVDSPLIWLNLLYLMTIGLIPFVTSVLSDHGTALATSLYAAVLVAACLLSAVMWAYALRDAELIPERLSAEVRREGLLGPLATACVFALSIAVALLWDATAAQFSWLLALPAHHVIAYLSGRRNLAA